MTINGELKIIGNSIVGLNETLNNVTYTPNDNYNGNLSNNQRTFGYIDVDNDQNTFSSSSAEFVSNGTCAKVAYAGLYWAASYFVERNAEDDRVVKYTDLPFPDDRPDFRTLKFKPPGVIDYMDISPSDTQVIFDGYRNTATNPENTAVLDIPYVCYADVTNIVKGLSTIDGVYTVADMRASIGFSGLNTNGISGGWVLVIAYEDETLSKKFISTNNGYLNIIPSNLDKSLVYSGFQTPPAPLPVSARYAIAAIDGEFDFDGDQLSIINTNGSKQQLFTAPANVENNFFDSSISVDGNYVINRSPASQNTLGMDIDIFNVPNPGNTVIGNNQNSIELKFSSKKDVYNVFFNSFQVEVVEPDLLVTERVFNVNGIDITGNSVNFSDELFYELTIENTGNEDIINASIKDILPSNVDFKVGSVSVSNPGINVVSDPNNRELNITIDDALLIRNGSAHTIRFVVSVVASCADLRDACSNEIDNAVTYTCTGADSRVTNIGESISEKDSCKNDIKSIPNILIREDVCFSETRQEIICLDSLTLTAGFGFTDYKWVDIANTNVIIGTTQTINVTKAGTYVVTKTGGSDCRNATETVEVISGGSIVNPIINIVNNLGIISNVNGNIRICPITGEQIPEIFLCGAGTTLNIPINFPVDTTVIWERLDPSACSSVVRDPDCPTRDVACNGDWVQVSTDINIFTLTQAGEYRIRTTFEGDCANTFYFNVFQNNFDPELVVVKEMICGTPGTVRVQNSSDQYEYQLVPPTDLLTDYQASPVFTGLIEAGTYTVNVRQRGGLSTDCVFQDTVYLEERISDVVVTTISPICIDDLGEVHIKVANSEINYTYIIKSSTSNFEMVEGPTTVSEHVFSGLNPDTYSVEVLSYDGNCTNTFSVEILPVESVKANLILVKDLSCNLGYQPDPTLNDPTHPNFDPSALPFDPDLYIALVELKVTGGLANYVVSTTSDFSTILSPELGTTDVYRITTNGSYDFFVGDQENNCSVSAGTIVVSPFQEIQANAIASTINCIDDLGSIEIIVTSGEGPFSYTLDQTTTVGQINENTYTFNNIDPSTSHTITVVDSQGCDTTLPEIVFSVPEPITVDFSVTQPTNQQNDGEIVVNVEGGTPPYTYSINNSSPIASNIFTDLTSGVYTIMITDNNACTYKKVVEIESFFEEINNPLIIRDFTAINKGKISCDNPETVIVSIIGGVGPFNFEEVSGAVPSQQSVERTSIFALPNVEQYIFRITDTATGSFIDSTPYDVTPFDTMTATLTVVVDETCNTSGEIDLTIAGYVGAYNYIVTNAITGTVVVPSRLGNTAINPLTIRELSGGDYQVLIEALDAPFCNEVSSTITIAEPIPVTIRLQIQDDTCITTNANTVEVIGGGGNGRYDYGVSSNNGITIVWHENNIFTNLLVGDYKFYVKDSNGCEAQNSDIIKVRDPEPLSVTLDLSNTSIICFGESTASINAITTGGIGNYRYSLTGIDYLGFPVNLNFQTKSFFTNLSAGTYNYIVTSGDCVKNIQEFTISQSKEIIADSYLTPISCKENQDGKIKITISGGIAPYFYSLYNNTDIVFNFIEDDHDGISGEHTFENLSADTYRVIVEDTNGCTIIKDIIISEPTMLDMDIAIDQLQERKDSKITVSAFGGIAPYIYELRDASNSKIIVPEQADNIFYVIEKGSYVVNITDTNGCILTQLITIEEDRSPIIDYAEEILFCAVIGEEYPVISIEDRNGKALEISILGAVSIVWQKLDDISCNIKLQDNCPTTDSSCSSNWFNIQTGVNCTIMDEGEYRVVITFANKKGNNVKTYYFKARDNMPDIVESFIMYPNPSNDIVTINTEVKNIKVFDAIGKLVIETTQNTYNIADLRNGIYFAKIVTKKGKESIIKLIKE